jgi:hypothetical protein
MLTTSKPLDILMPGRKIVLDNVNWQEYQKILDQLGELSSCTNPNKGCQRNKNLEKRA